MLYLLMHVISTVDERKVWMIKEIAVISLWGDIGCAGKRESCKTFVPILRDYNWVVFP